MSKPTTKKKIAIVDGDYWQGLYLNGKCVDQGHVLQLCDIFEAIGIECEFISADNEWLDEHGSLPEKLKDVKRYKE